MTNHYSQEARRAATLAFEHSRGVHEDSPHADCTACAEDHEPSYADLDSAFGYTPGEDRCPSASRILDNEAFLTDAELAALITCHPACRP